MQIKNEIDAKHNLYSILKGLHIMVNIGVLLIDSSLFYYKKMPSLGSRFFSLTIFKNLKSLYFFPLLLVHQPTEIAIENECHYSPNSKSKGMSHQSGSKSIMI